MPEVPKRGVSYGRKSLTKSRLYNRTIKKWWLTRKIRISSLGDHLEYQGIFWQTYYKLGHIYLDNLTGVRYTIELSSFILSIWFVNTGSLLLGIVVGAIGILFINRISKTEISILAVMIASSQIDESENRGVNTLTEAYQ